MIKQAEPDSISVVPTRTLVRTVAEDFLARNIYPTAESVRREINKRTGRSPSATTISEEIKIWYEDTFWPRVHVLDDLPEDSPVPEELHRLFSNVFQHALVNIMDVAKSSWHDERIELERQVAETRQHFSELTGRMQEQSAALAAQKLAYDAEVAEHRGTREKLDALQLHVQDLSSKLQSAQVAMTKHERELADVKHAERERADKAIDHARAEHQRVMVELDATRQAVKRQDAINAALTAESRLAQETISKQRIDGAALLAELATLEKTHAAEVAALKDALQLAQARVVEANMPRKVVATPREKPTVIRRSLRRSNKF